MKPRRRNSITEQFAAFPISLLESSAWAAISLSGRRLLDRLAIELRNHHGYDNGKLPLTFQDLVDFGLNRASIAPAQREVEALGFAFITRRGHGGKISRVPNLWRITFLQTASGSPTHEWRKITTIEDALETAKAARLNKSPRAVAKGKRAAATFSARSLTKDSADIGKRTHSMSETNIGMTNLPMPGSDTTGPVQKQTPLSISRLGEHRSGDDQSEPSPMIGFPSKLTSGAGE